MRRILNVKNAAVNNFFKNIVTCYIVDAFDRAFLIACVMFIVYLLLLVRPLSDAELTVSGSELTEAVFPI